MIVLRLLRIRMLVSLAFLATTVCQTGNRAAADELVDFFIEFKPKGAAQPADAAKSMFRACSTKSPSHFVEHLLLGVCDGRVDSLNKYAESLHRTKFHSSTKSASVFDLRKKMKKDSIRVIASEEFSKKDSDSVQFLAVSSYWGKQLTCVEVAADNPDGNVYRTRIIVAKVNDRWFAMPRCKSSELFYKIADKMKLTPVKAPPAKTNDKK